MTNPSASLDLSNLHLDDIHLDTGTIPEVGESDLEAYLRDRLADRLETAPRPDGHPLGSDDRVLVDVVVTLEGEEYPRAAIGGEWLSASSPLAFIREALTGAKVGEAVETLASFPSDFPDDGLAGKRAELAITVCEARPLPPLDLDDPAVRAALGFGETVEAIRAAARQSVAEELRHRRGQRTREDLLDALFERVEVSCPDEEIDAALEAAWSAQWRPAYEAEGASAEELELVREQFLDSLEMRAAYARASCARQVFAALAEAHALDVAAQADSARGLLARRLELSPEVLASAVDDEPGLAEAAEDLALELAALGFLLSKVQLAGEAPDATDMV